MKNYKVISFITYGGAILGERVFLYDWYWVANLRSWFDHNFWGCGCNIFVRDGAKVKPRPVVWK